MPPAVPQDLTDRIAALERLVDELAGRVAIRPALSEIKGGDVTISQGGRLIVTTPAGQQTLYIGRIDPVHPDGSDQQGFVLRREDGSVAFSVYNATGASPQPVTLWDKLGNAIAADDLTGGGLARPYLDASGWFGATEAPAFTTSSASFVTLQNLPWIKQHPRITAHYLVQTSAGTTGELRLIDDSSNVIVGPLSIGAASYFYSSATGPISGSHMTTTYLHWQARVTGGAGSIGVKGLSTFGVQS